MAEPKARELPDVLVAPRELLQKIKDTLVENGIHGDVVRDLSRVLHRDKVEHEWQGRHLANRDQDGSWVVTLVSEEPAEGHIENLMETVAMLAATNGESGRPLSLERETQRKLMKRGIAVTIG